MAKQIRTLTPGQQVTGHFQGSFGNSSYDMELTFMNYDAEQGTASFMPHDGSGEFDVYRYNNRWSYGSGADRFSITM